MTTKQEENGGVRSSMHRSPPRKAFLNTTWFKNEMNNGFLPNIKSMPTSPMRTRNPSNKNLLIDIEQVESDNADIFSNSALSSRLRLSSPTPKIIFNNLHVLSPKSKQKTSRLKNVSNMNNDLKELLANKKDS